MNRALAGMLLVFGLVPVAGAQDYPARSVHIVVPFAPGGATDAVTRVIAGKLSTALGQSVVVENKPGADGTIGIAAVARAAPDGYTLGVGNNGPLAINPSVTKSMPFDPAKDLTPVIMLVSYPYFVMTRPGLPVQSMKDLVAYSKANPGKVNFATAGNVTRLGGAMMRSMAGTQMVFVPFNGNGPALTALLGGHVDVLFASPKPKGDLRTLAVTGSKRFSLDPDVPTIAESAIPGFDVTAWLGVVAPAGTPKEIVKRLNTEIAAILKMDDVRAKLAAVQVEVAGGSPEEFGSVIKDEIAKWARVVKEAGISPE